MAQEEYVGPLTTVEIMLLNGEANRHDKDIRFLKETISSLEKSLDLKKREFAQFQAAKDKIIREIVKGRGKNPGSLPVRQLDRIQDNTTWIIVGGAPPT